MTLAGDSGTLDNDDQNNRMDEVAMAKGDMLPETVPEVRRVYALDELRERAQIVKMGNHCIGNFEFVTMAYINPQRLDRTGITSEEIYHFKQIRTLESFRAHSAVWLNSAMVGPADHPGIKAFERERGHITAASIARSARDKLSKFITPNDSEALAQRYRRSVKAGIFFDLMTTDGRANFKPLVATAKLDRIMDAVTGSGAMSDVDELLNRLKQCSKPNKGLEK